MTLVELKALIIEHANTLIPSEYKNLIYISTGPTVNTLILQNTNTALNEHLSDQLGQKTVSVVLSRQEQLAGMQILQSYALKDTTGKEDVEELFKIPSRDLLQSERRVLENNMRIALSSPASKLYQFLQLAMNNTSKGINKGSEHSAQPGEILKEPNKLHNRVLNFMIEYRMRHPGFVFWLRRYNTRNRLNEGFWFQGTQHYAFVGLYDTWSGNLATKGIGLVFWPTERENEFGLSFEVIFKAEERPEYLAFFRDLVDMLDEFYKSQLEKLADSHFRITLSKSNAFPEAEKFLDRFSEKIDALVGKHGLHEIYIGTEMITERLKRIESIKKEIYAGKVLVADKQLSALPPQSDDAIEDDFTPNLTIDENSNVDLQYDAPSKIDELGRRPFVDTLYEYINRLWDSSNEKKSYTIHLNGEWGSGKSTVLGLLKEKLEKNPDDKEWVVVEFNAWENQHIQEPWWIFLDKVFKTIVASENIFGRIKVKIKETCWRVVSMNRTKWMITFILAFVAASSLATDFSFIRLFAEKPVVDIGTLTTFLSLIGTIALFVSSIINSLLPGSEEAASRYRQQVRDPMKNIKDHYEDVINYTKKNVAVFIDDIDRCDPKFVVQLLEGLQTLFKTGKVLYIVAGDGMWIRESFELHYGPLKNTITKQGQSLGNFFLEKSLQQSVTIPKMTDEMKRSYWSKLVQKKQPVLDETKYVDSIIRIDQAVGEIEMNEIIQNASTDEEKTILREKAAVKVSTKKIIKDIEHQLLKYVDLIEANPRSMKRLINNIAVEKAANYLAGKNDKINEDEMIRWAIFRSQYPVIANDIIKDPAKLSIYQDINLYPKIDSILRGVTRDTIGIMNE